MDDLCLSCRRWTAPPNEVLCEFCLSRRQRLWANAEDDEEERQRRIALFEQRKPPARTAFPGDPRGWEQEQPMAELTALGRRLLGLDRW